MADPTFTILMPVIRTPELMLFAINSVLSQTRGDFELFIVCDGAPLETIRAAETISAHDGRIRVFSFPKGEGHGEAHRHTVLQEARGSYICGLADDDLWFPEHLDEMDALLSEFEFGNLLHANVMVDAPLFIGLSDFGDPKIRSRMMSEQFNIFGPSHAGYRLDTYNRLPVGWSPAPEGDYSDLAMWRKFIALPNLVAGTRFVLTSFHFASPHRRTWSVQERREETAMYAALLATPQGRNTLRHWAFREVAREYTASHEYISSSRNYIETLTENIAAAARRADVLKETAETVAKTMEAELNAMRSSLSWRITAPLRYVARPIASLSRWRAKEY